MLSLLLAATSASPADKPRKDGGVSSGITREQADAILEELRQIRQLLEKQQQPTRVGGPQPQQRVKLTARPQGHVLGRPDAPVTLVEFTDYQCPYCQRFNNATFPELKKKYVDTGKLRYVSRDFPLDMHTQAFGAAKAARCADEQGKYWEMRQSLFADGRKLSTDDFVAYAGTIQADVPLFEKCLAADRVDADIRADQAEATSVSISGTPSFVVAKTSADTLDGVLLVGAQPLAAFESRIEELLPK